MTTQVKAGPELDALIAEKVMGQTRSEGLPGKFEPQIGRWPYLPPYSTNIEAAWEVAEKLRLCVVPVEDATRKGWTAFAEGRWAEDGAANATVSAPLSICLAALELQHQLEFCAKMTEVIRGRSPIEREEANL